MNHVALPQGSHFGGFGFGENKGWPLQLSTRLRIASPSPLTLFIKVLVICLSAVISMCYIYMYSISIKNVDDGHKNMTWLLTSLRRNNDCCALAMRLAMMKEKEGRGLL